MNYIARGWRDVIYVVGFDFETYKQALQIVVIADTFLFYSTYKSKFWKIACM